MLRGTVAVRTSTTDSSSSDGAQRIEHESSVETAEGRWVEHAEHRREANGAEREVERIAHTDASGASVEQETVTTTDAAGSGETLTRARTGAGRWVFSKVAHAPAKLKASAVFAAIVAAFLLRDAHVPAVPVEPVASNAPAAAAVSPPTPPVPVAPDPLAPAAVEARPPAETVPPVPAREDVSRGPRKISSGAPPTAVVAPAEAAEPSIEEASPDECGVEGDGSATGWIIVDTQPAAQLFDRSGNLLGDTPIVRLELPAGCHPIRAVSWDGRHERSVRMEVRPKATLRYSFALEPVDLPDLLGDAEILRVLRQHKDDIAACKDDQLRHDPALSGVMTVKLLIEPTGRTSHLAVAPGLWASTRLAECVLGSVRAWVFPRFSGEPTPLDFPVTLRQGAD